MFKCNRCNYQAKFKRNLMRHSKSVHDHANFQCFSCKKSFTRKNALSNHINSLHPSTTDHRIKRTIHGTYKCGFCEIEFASPADAHKHRQGDTPVPNLRNAKLQEEPIEPICDLTEVEQKFWHLIRTHHHRTSRPQDRYNFRLITYRPSEIKEYINSVFSVQKFKFKISVALGFLLRDKITGELTYFYASHNTMMTKPNLISNRSDIDRFLDNVDSWDLVEHASLKRLNSKFVVHKVTNMLVYVNKLFLYPIGRPDHDDDPVRVFIRNSRSIIGLFCDKNDGRPYKDNLCFFRCLALHQQSPITALERPSAQLLTQWTDQTATSFPGITLEELYLAEDTYKINIHVYSLVDEEPTGEGATDEEIVEEYVRRESGEDIEPIDLGPDDDGFRGQLIHRSRGAYESDMYLNLNDGHFSYIQDIQRYARAYKCSKCDRLFNRRGNYMHHETLCTASIKYKFPGGGHNHNTHIFDRLAKEGIVVEDRYYHYRAAFDYESLFQSIESGDGRLQFSNELIPASWSVCSNIPGTSTISGKDFTSPHCEISTGDPKALVSKMVVYLSEMSDQSYIVMADKYRSVLQRLSQEVQVYNNHQDRLHQLRQSRGSAADIEQVQRDLRNTKKWTTLYEDFDLWLHQLPVLGFNSGKFDLNLIQKYLISYLLSEDVITCTIKRGNNYMALASSKLLFLDITNYLSPGTSYDKWIKAFQIPQAKGVWPYEWFTDLHKLDESLPPRDAFYSTLRQEELSQEDYAHARQTWEEERFCTMRDMLVWYNNLDVGPFLLAVDKMVDHWAQYEIDMFKMGCISIPGLAYKQVIQSMPSDIHLPIWSENSKEWHHKCKRDLVGGPSIIFHRYHEVGQTRIRGGKEVQSIAGFDANALYLYCTGQNMPTGCPGLWITSEEGTDVPVMNEDVDVDVIITHNMSLPFSRRLDFKGSSEEITWLEDQFQKICAQNPDRKLNIMHSMNGGQKWFKIQGSRLFVDGYIPELGIILQYHGCRWHGHDCRLTRNHDLEEMTQNRERTERVTRLLQTLSMTIIEETQCEFYERQRTDPELRLYALSRKLPMRNEATAGELVQAIQDGTFFGIVEVDIQVPWWVPGIREHMAEMPPIFKNTDIQLEDIGDHMKAHAESEGIRLPRRGLIGSYFAKSMVFTSPLLQWYLQNGLIITRVYGGAQFIPNPCFKTLTEEITENRRQADQDPAKKILGELSKLTGNSLYGKSITDKERHLNITYCKDQDASSNINNPLFRSLNLMENHICEIQQAKGRVTFNLPSLMAFFVYGYAKLKMLEFYYSFLLPVLGTQNFQMIEMDTDSYYFALSATNLEEAVPIDRRTIYNQLKSQFLALSPYEQRTPGLFKLEWSGTGMLALNSKTYYAWGETTKYSSKGLSKRTNHLTAEDFRSVLFESQRGGGINHGFRMYKGRLLQYSQERDALTYFYAKRKVTDDRVSTEPINI